MLRISGVLAFLLSCGLGILLFSRVQTFQLHGIARNVGQRSFQVHVDTGPGIVPQFASQAPASLPGTLLLANGNHVVGWVFDFGGDSAHEIPDNARVVVTHRSVSFRPILWTFGSTELKSKGRITFCERSLASLFCWIGLIAAAPFFVWILIATPVIWLQKPKWKDGRLPNAEPA